MIRSLKRALAAERAMRAQLERAQVALAALSERRRGKKRFTTVGSLREG